MSTPAASKRWRLRAGSASRTTWWCASRRPARAAASTCARSRAPAAATWVRTPRAFKNSLHGPGPSAARRIIRAAMTTDFKLTPHADYLHVALAPGYEIRPQGATELMKSVSDVCTRQGHRRVLIEGTVAARRMATMDSFAIGTLAGSMLPAYRSPAASTAITPTTSRNSSRTSRRTAACGSSFSASATRRCAGSGCTLVSFRFAALGKKGYS